MIRRFASPQDRASQPPNPRRNSTRMYRPRHDKPHSLVVAALILFAAMLAVLTFTLAVVVGDNQPVTITQEPNN